MWELDRERVSEDDIVSLPVHQCYVRATVGSERTPTFSMEVRKPAAGDAGVAARIREAARPYSVSAAEVAAREAHHAGGRVKEYRERLEALKAGDSPRRSKRRSRRSKHPRAGTASQESAEGKEDEG